MKLTTADNVALFHARALRDYCANKKCKDCVFRDENPESYKCALDSTSPNFWNNIERRDLDNAVVD